MIEFTKVSFACGHIERYGSTFGETAEIAESNAREAGYLVERTSADPCYACRVLGKCPTPETRGMTEAVPSAVGTRNDILQGAFGRYVIVQADDHSLAWTGSGFDRHQEGIPTGQSQVCNFESTQEAQQYISQCPSLLQGGTGDNAL